MISVEILGNEAAEDENPDFLQSYFVEKEEFNGLINDDVTFQIIKGKKGVGKSACLCRVSYVKTHEKNTLIVDLKGSDLYSGGNFECKTANEYIFEWEQRICNLVNLELGKKIGFGFSDDAISMVEQAEISGFKSRNLVGSLIDRMNIKIAGLDYKQKSVINDRKLLERYVEANNNVKVWVIVDDIDSTFIRNDDEILRLSTFFSACRGISRFIKDLNVRCSVRDDVWTTIYGCDESLDKCLQYIANISWSFDDMRTMFAFRIHAYLVRKGRTLLKPRSNTKKRALISIYFPALYPWGDRRTYMQPILSLHELKIL